MFLAILLFAAAPIVKKAADMPLKAILGGKGKAAILLDPALTKTFALDYLEGEAGAEVTKHVHAGAAEILFVIEGECTTTVGDTTLTLMTGDTLYVPPDTPHSAVFTKKTRVVQIYTPPGPEQRFKL
jgi:quercetin dioxygenase-like cupin family protein